MVAHNYLFLSSSPNKSNGEQIWHDVLEGARPQDIVSAQIRPASGPIGIHTYQMWDESEPNYVAVWVVA